MHGDLDLLKRVELTGAPQDQDHRALHLVRFWGVAVGSLILLGACLYRRVKHPDWTGAQALAILWPIYLVAGISICSGWLFSNATMTDGGIVKWCRFFYSTFARRALGDRRYR